MYSNEFHHRDGMLMNAMNHDIARIMGFTILLLAVITTLARGQAHDEYQRVPAKGKACVEQPKNPYLGQKPPGLKPEIFAPGIVSTDAHEFACSFTPDGAEFYFTRMDQNRRNHIMLTKLAGNAWTTPEVVSFIDGKLSFEPRITPDGKRLYFTLDQLVPGQTGGIPMNIWYVEREGKTWSAPKDPGSAFNPGKTMYVSSTLDGTLYASDISGGPGNMGIGVIRKVNGEYQKLERLGPPINVGKQDMHPYIAPDESYLIFASKRSGENVNGELFISFKKTDGSWGEPKAIDLGMQAGCPMVSPDGKYLFFTAGERGKSDIYWVDASVLQDRHEQTGGPQGMQLTPTEIDTKCAETFIDVKGRKLHAKVYGAGSPTIVLLSGFMAPQWYWNSIVPELAELSTVVTYDRPGIGRSELGGAPCDARRAADDLDDLLRQLGVPKPYVLVGHSYGCRVAELYSAYYPDGVAAILMEDGQHPGILEAQRKVLTGSDLEKLEAMVARTSTPDNPRTERDYSLISVQQALECPPMPRVPYTVLTAGDRSGAMPPIFSPEGRDKLIAVEKECLEDFVALVPNGKHIIVEGSGHVIHEDKKDTVIEEITALVKKVRAAK